MKDWPKHPTKWINNGTLHISIPFTWNLPYVREILNQRSFEWESAIVGGPAVKLIPHFFDDLQHVRIGWRMNGVLQRINPLSTKTTEGCIRRCGFCAVPHTEGKLIELEDWPDLPILIDNNLLAASQPHFDKVIDRLIKWGWADFNQGIDSRILTHYHAERFAQIKKPLIRLALDNIAYRDKWEGALELLLKARISKKNIRSYALAGFDSDPGETWQRCKFIESQGIKVLPAWFHRLDAMKHGVVTEEQKNLGWTDYERRRLMQWFYKHKKAVKY